MVFNMEKEKVKEEFKKLFKYGHPLFYDIIIDNCQLHNNKNRDYATLKEPLGNFTRVGKWAREYGLITEGYEATKIALLYALKQWDAVLKLLRDNQKGKVEGIPERLNDISVYSVIARILYQEEGKGSELYCSKCKEEITDDNIMYGNSPILCGKCFKEKGE